MELFDDGAEPSTIGYTAEALQASSADPILRDRILTADSVVRARVVTLTSRETGLGWLVGLRTVETLAGNVPVGEIALQVSPKDEAAGLIRAFDDRLVGTSVVLFFRSFRAPASSVSGGGDTRTVHFHIAADSPAEVRAIRASTLLSEVK